MSFAAKGLFIIYSPFLSPHDHRNGYGGVPLLYAGTVKAQTLGIKIITEDEFEEMLK